MYIDTHCHINFAAYKNDRDEVIASSLKEGVAMIVVGTQKDTSKEAAELARQHKGIYAAVGVHPTHVVSHGYNDEEELDFKPRAESFDTAYYESLLHEKVVAVGEYGLDYYRLPDGDKEEMKRKQWDISVKEMQFAIDHNLPSIIHCRDAHEDMVKMIKELSPEKKGVIHCFTGTYEEAKVYVDLGWYISFTGIAVLNKDVGEVAKTLPLESIMIETDAPYLTPPPHRGKRNEPKYVKLIAQHLAEERGVSEEEFAQQTSKNAENLFGIDIL